MCGNFLTYTGSSHRIWHHDLPVKHPRQWWLPCCLTVIAVRETYYNVIQNTPASTCTHTHVCVCYFSWMPSAWHIGGAQQVLVNEQVIERRNEWICRHTIHMKVSQNNAYLTSCILLHDQLNWVSWSICGSQTKVWKHSQEASHHTVRRPAILLESDLVERPNVGSSQGREVKLQYEEKERGRETTERSIRPPTCAQSLLGASRAAQPIAEWIQACNLANTTWSTWPSPAQISDPENLEK